jgi:hypothetical protein
MIGRLKTFGSSVRLTSHALNISFVLRASRRSKRLIIFDPGYIQPSGHHSEFNYAIGIEARRRGMQVFLIANARARRINYRPGIQRRLFRVSPYRKVEWRLSPARYLLEDKAKAYQDLSQLSNADFRPDDIVL